MYQIIHTHDPQFCSNLEGDKSGEMHARKIHSKICHELQTDSTSAILVLSPLSGTKNMLQSLLGLEDPNNNARNRLDDYVGLVVIDLDWNKLVRSSKKFEPGTATEAFEDMVRLFNSRLKNTTIVTVSRPTTFVNREMLISLSPPLARPRTVRVYVHRVCATVIIMSF